MALLPYPLARSLLFSMDAEAAHDFILDHLARMQHTPLQALWSQARIDDPVHVAGLTFPNRVGLAAGLDKNGRCIDALGAMGFGFIEVGTVTPRAQPGNPRPRIFRLPQAQALINRLGFNNDGLDVFLGNVRRARFRAMGGVLGLNIGKNADTPLERAADDYLRCLDAVHGCADYVAVNISSPNTVGLRGLQADQALDQLLALLRERAEQLDAAAARRVPLFLKIAPDLDEPQIAQLAATVQRHALDGIIATNTTVARDVVRQLPHGTETGGLSGAPVAAASNRVIRLLRAALGPAVPIIGVGGILGGDDARAKLNAGATLVQIYTGLIYRGPALVTEVARALRVG